MKGSRVPALLVGLAAALTLSACGVPPSGVIQAGSPASGIFSPTPTPRPPALAAISLFFVHKGDLTPYSRKTPHPGDMQATVRLLFGGLTASEAATATTELPRLTEAPAVTIDSDNTVVIQLPEDVAPFSRLAMLQLECTLANAYSLARLSTDTGGAGAPGDSPSSSSVRLSATPTSVRVVGSGWTRTQQAGSCPDPL